MPIHAPTTAPTRDPVPITCGQTTVEGGAVGGGTEGGGAVGGGAVGGEGNNIGRIGPARDPGPITCGHAPKESIHVYSCTKLIFIIV